MLVGARVVPVCVVGAFSILAEISQLAPAGMEVQEAVFSVGVSRMLRPGRVLRLVCTCRLVRGEAKYL